MYPMVRRYLHLHYMLHKKQLCKCWSILFYLLILPWFKLKLQSWMCGQTSLSQSTVPIAAVHSDVQNRIKLTQSIWLAILSLGLHWINLKVDFHCQFDFSGLWCHDLPEFLGIATARRSVRILTVISVRFWFIGLIWNLHHNTPAWETLAMNVQFGLKWALTKRLVFLWCFKHSFTPDQTIWIRECTPETIFFIGGLATGPFPQRVCCCGAACVYHLVLSFTLYLSLLRNLVLITNGCHGVTS